MKKSVFAKKEISVVFFSVLILFALSGFTPTDNHLVRIETAVMAQDYEQARDLARDYISQAPQGQMRDKARYYLGLTHLRLAEYDKARRVLHELKADLTVPELLEKVYSSLFDAYYLDRQYDQAYPIIMELLQKRPDSDAQSLIYLKAARVSLKLALWQEAKGYLTRIITQFPYSLEAFSAKQLLEEKQYFAVQVGSFAQRMHAEKLMEELKHKGEYAYIVETVLKDSRTFYRVRVGQMASLKSAQKLKLKLAKEGYPASIYP